MEVLEIAVEQALERLEGGATVFIDVRDGASYRQGHIPGAKHIGDHNIADFVERSDKSEPVVVYCFHGNSSLGGAAHLLSQGFEEVYSMSGGFSAWGSGPVESEPEPERPQAAAPPSPRSAPAPQPDVQRDAQPDAKPSRRRRLLSHIRSLLPR
jgi:thiosulfate sulfurtransferase